MSGLFSKPKIPNQTAFSAPPARDAADVQAEVASDRARRASMRGRGSTVLTAISDSPAGDRRKTLLGE